MTRTSKRNRLDLVLASLADPTRRGIFETILARPGITSSELAGATSSISRWGVIKHLAVLRDAGLVQTMATGRLRRHYAEPAALQAVRGWLDGI